MTHLGVYGVLKGEKEGNSLYVRAENIEHWMIITIAGENGSEQGTEYEELYEGRETSNYRSLN